MGSTDIGSQYIDSIIYSIRLTLLLFPTALFVCFVCFVDSKKTLKSITYWFTDICQPRVAFSADTEVRPPVRSPYGIGRRSGAHFWGTGVAWRSSRPILSQLSQPSHVSQRLCGQPWRAASRLGKGPTSLSLPVSSDRLPRPFFACRNSPLFCLLFWNPRINLGRKLFLTPLVTDY